jgi:hypothetical protein
MTNVFVVTQNGQRFEGDLETTKRSIEYAVKTMVDLGSGVVITDASPELTEFLLDLQKRYPPK